MPRSSAPLAAATLFAILPALAGCLGPGAPTPPPEPDHIVAWLGEKRTYEGAWDPSALASVLERLGYNLTYRNETSLLTNGSDEISLHLRQEAEGAWSAEAARVFWRVDACSMQGLDAWRNATWEGTAPLLAAALGRLEREAGVRPQGDGTQTFVARTSSGAPLSLPEQCPAVGR